MDPSENEYEKSAVISGAGSEEEGGGPGRERLNKR